MDQDKADKAQLCSLFLIELFSDRELSKTEAESLKTVQVMLMPLIKQVTEAQMEAWIKNGGDNDGTD